MQGLCQQVAAHIEAGKTGARKHKLLLACFRAQLVKFLANLAVAATQLVSLLVAVQRNVDIGEVFANEGAVAIGDYILWIVHQNPVEGLLRLFQATLRQVDFTQQPLDFKRVWITRQNLLAVGHRVVDLTRADGILYTLNTITKRCLRHKYRSPVSRL